MRTIRSMQLLATLAIAAACGSSGDSAAVPAASPPPPPAAQPAPAPVVVAPPPVVEQPSGVSLSVRWDSRPLDREYQRERAALDARHARELAQARADEKADARARRQAEETRALEDRYERGKKQHARGLPPQQ
jgi:hypothetical protein